MGRRRGEDSEHPQPRLAHRMGALRGSRADACSVVIGAEVVIPERTLYGRAAELAERAVTRRDAGERTKKIAAAPLPAGSLRDAIEQIAILAQAPQEGRGRPAIVHPSIE